MLTACSAWQSHDKPAGVAPPARPQPVQQEAALPAEKRDAPGRPKLSSKDRMMRVALKMRGKPYRYTGASPQGFDASGLVYYSHLQVGLNVPRSFRKQFHKSRPVRRERLRPGDLVFFSLGTSNATHVGIYLGVDKFVHVPPMYDRVILSDMNTAFWKENFIRGGRLAF
jgi:cell wall-associated NlpC family hydrolase